MSTLLSHVNRTIFTFFRSILITIQGCGQSPMPRFGIVGKARFGIKSHLPTSIYCIGINPTIWWERVVVRALHLHIMYCSWPQASLSKGKVHAVGTRGVQLTISNAIYLRPPDPFCSCWEPCGMLSLPHGNPPLPWGSHGCHMTRPPAPPPPFPGGSQSVELMSKIWVLPAPLSWACTKKKRYDIIGGSYVIGRQDCFR